MSLEVAEECRYRSALFGRPGKNEAVVTLYSCVYVRFFVVWLFMCSATKADWHNRGTG